MADQVAVDEYRNMMERVLLWMKQVDQKLARMEQWTRRHVEATILPVGFAPEVVLERLDDVLVGELLKCPGSFVQVEADVGNENVVSEQESVLQKEPEGEDSQTELCNDSLLQPKVEVPAPPEILTYSEHEDGATSDVNLDQPKVEVPDSPEILDDGFECQEDWKLQLEEDSLEEDQDDDLTQDEDMSEGSVAVLSNASKVLIQAAKSEVHTRALLRSPLEHEPCSTMSYKEEIPNNKRSMHRHGNLEGKGNSVRGRGGIAKIMEKNWVAKSQPARKSLRTEERPRVPMQKHRKKGTKEKCKFCSYECERKGTMIEHMMIHTGEKPFVCTTCNKAFRRKSHLHVHLSSVHAQKKPYSCKQCGKKFSQKTHVNVHVISVHAGKTPHICSECGKGYSQMIHLKIHMRSHTGEKPYHCNVCGKTFSSKYAMETHEKLHSGEKPFHCKVCGKKFSQKPYMNRHYKRHTGELYDCKICGKKFFFRSSLNRHAIKHTG